jgi:molecular chaperone GrpE
LATLLKEYNRTMLPPANLAGDIDKLRDDLRDERDRNLRTLADFTNYRRRIERDGHKLAEEGKRDIILPLLGIIDDLENALRWSNGDEPSVVRGVRLIHHKCLALLEAQGVRPFESVGTQFNPHRHEAVAVAEQENREPGTVVDELRRGYLWNNELLRAAQVRVAE